MMANRHRHKRGGAGFMFCLLILAIWAGLIVFVLA